MEKLVEKTVADTLSRLKNGNGNGRYMPKTLWEFLWQGAQTFGIPAVAFGVVLLIIYQTFPAWIQANIETQVSLTKNLDVQSDNLKQLSNTLDDVARYSRETEVFRKQVVVEHKTMAADIDSVKQCTTKLEEGQARQQTEHLAIVETLKKICDELKKQ